MIRKDSPQLKAELNAMLGRYPKGSGQRGELLTKYFKLLAEAGADRERAKETVKESK